ncbi:MAG: hypothetical protein J6Q68_00800 [Clostridia bacterium]|nr:hypothetical protein [Clostridia bacterium]
MKKYIAIMLAVLCLFSVVSCNGTTCEKHVDANEDGKCDVCETEYVCPGHVDADEDEVCDECGAPYVYVPEANTVEAALATLISCYANSAPTKVVTNTLRVIGTDAYDLEGTYTLVTGTFAGKVATVYHAQYEELRTVEEGADEILSEIKTVEYKKEFLEGKGVRENGGSWKNSGANFAPAAGSIALNISLDDITNVEFTNEKYNNTVTFSVPKAKIKTVFGVTDGLVNLDADSAVQVTITNNGATVTSVTLSYSIKKSGDVPAQTVTISTVYSYEIQTLTIE